MLYIPGIGGGGGCECSMALSSVSESEEDEDKDEDDVGKHPGDVALEVVSHDGFVAQGVSFWLLATEAESILAIHRS